MVAAAILLAYWGRGQWFRGDDLGYAVRLATEPLGHALLYPPPNKYLIAVPLLLYKGMFETFGLDSYVPYRAVSIALVLLCAGLLFVLLRRRVGDLFAVPPTVLMLFFGSGARLVVTPEWIPSQFALAAGLAMMVALERRDLRGDLAATLLLAISLASHPLGIAFAAAAGVTVVLRPAPARWRRLWVLLAPSALFAAWWFFLRPPTTPTLVPNRPSDVFPFVRQSWAAVTAAISGLFGVLDKPAFQEPLGWVAAGLLLVLLLFGIAWGWKRLPPSFWAALVGLVVLMAATRLAPGGFLRVADNPRYLYPEAFFLLLVLADLAGALRLPNWVMWTSTAVLILSLWPNIDRLHDAGRQARLDSDLIRARWGAVEIAGQNAQPDFRPDVYSPTASEYIHATRAYGTAAYPPATLATRSAPVRAVADTTLVGALGLELRPAPPVPPAQGRPPRVKRPFGSAAPARGCRAVQPPLATFALPKGGASIRADRLGDATFSLGRFADQPTVPLTPPANASAAALRIPPDDLRAPWKLLITSREPVTVCGLVQHSRASR
jgi:hypothetical protein